MNDDSEVEVRLYEDHVVTPDVPMIETVLEELFWGCTMLIGAAIVSDTLDLAPHLIASINQAPGRFYFEKITDRTSYECVGTYVRIRAAHSLQAVEAPA